MASRAAIGAISQPVIGASTNSFSMSAPFRHMQVEELAFCPDRGRAPISSLLHSLLRAGEGLAATNGLFFIAHRLAFASAISSAAAAISALVMSERTASAAHF